MAKLITHTTLRVQEILDMDPSYLACLEDEVDEIIRARIDAQASQAAAGGL